MVGDYMFFLGLLTAIVFFILLSLSFYLGYRFKRKKTTPAVDEEEQRLNKQIHKDFVKMMNYSVDKALERKKVNK